MPTSDALVVGAGIVGTTIALQLALDGMEVILLDRGQMASGSSALNGGGVRAQFDSDTNIAIARDTLESIASFRERHGEDVAFRQTGYLYTYASEGDASLWARAASRQRRFGVRCDLLDLDDLGALLPDMNRDGLVGAVFAPDSGYLDPRALTTAYGRAAIRAGVTFHPGAEVKAVDVEADRVLGVVTRTTRYSAAVVVNATGPWASTLAAMYGSSLPVTNVRQPHLFMLDRGLRSGGLTPFVLDLDQRVVLHSEGRGLVVGGGGGALVRGAIPERPVFDPGQFLQFRDRLAHRFPDTVGAAVVQGWSGFTDRTPDNNPVVGWSLRNLFTVAGMSGHGMCLAPGLAPVVSQVVRGEAPRIPLDEFSPSRFDGADLTQPEEEGPWHAGRMLAHARPD